MSRSLEPRLPAHAHATIRVFLKAELAGQRAVLGLSGGVDSALTAALVAEAIGADRVTGVLLPSNGPSGPGLEETRRFAESLGVDHRTIDLRPVVGALRSALPEITDRLAIGNLTARLRMLVLYGIARELSGRVVGTGNKSELLLGYFTKFGDGGADLLPLGDLYKTEVWELAEPLGVPEAVRTRPPSAGFWEGQTDEGEIGMPYREVDRVLRGLEMLLDEREIVDRTGFDPDAVRSIVERVDRNRHKRRPPPIPKVGLRTLGIDWRD